MTEDNDHKTDLWDRNKYLDYPRDYLIVQLMNKIKCIHNYFKN